MLRHPRTPYIIIALAMLLALPSIGIGVFGDDHVLNASLDHRLPYNPPWWDLYRLMPTYAHDVQVAKGELPWWAAPQLQLHLFRPLASALYAMDRSIFGAAPLGYHVHSLMWWLALLAVAHVGFSRLLPRPTATLALAVLAFSAVNTYPYGWTSARHGLVAAVLGIGGILLYVRAKRARATLLFVLALLASEGALGALAFAVMFDVLGNRDRRAGVRAAMLPVGIGLAYLIGYALMGAGARESGGYYSPFASPVQFVEAAAWRAPVLLANALLGVPAELSNVGAAAALVVVGIVATGMFAFAWRVIAPRVDVQERDALKWLVPGAVIAIFASVGAYPGARVLQLANFGFAPLIAVLIRHAFAAGPRAVARRAAGGLLVALHVVLAPLAALGNTANTIHLRQSTDAVARDARAAMNGARRTFTIASDPFVGLYAPTTLIDDGMTGCWSWLSAVKGHLQITRTGRGSLSLESLGTTFIRGSFETVYRDPRIVFHEGDEVTVCDARVRVDAVQDGLPKRISLFVEDLDAADTAILAWENGAMVRYALPAIGESRMLTWSKGPSGFF